MFSKCKSSAATNVTRALMENSTLSSSFPNLVTLAKIVSILPVAAATVERSFSSMNLVKTRLRSQLLCDTLDPVLFGKHRLIVIFYRQVCVSFLYLSCSAVMDSPGGKFNSYKSKHLGQM